MSFAYQRQFSSDSSNDIFKGDSNEKLANFRLWFSHLKLSNKIKIGIALAFFFTLIIVIVAIASKSGNSYQNAKPLASTKSPSTTTPAPPITQSTEQPKWLNLSKTPNQLNNLEDIFDKGGIILSLSSSNSSSSKLMLLNLENEKVQPISEPFKSLVSSLDFDWQQRYVKHNW